MGRAFQQALSESSEFDGNRAMSSLAAGFLSGQLHFLPAPPNGAGGKWKELSMKHPLFKNEEPTYTKKTKDKRVMQGMMALRK